MDKLEALKKDVIASLNHAIVTANCDCKATDYEKTTAFGAERALSYVLEQIKYYQALEQIEKGETK